MKKLKHFLMITAPLWILFIAVENLYSINEAIPFDHHEAAPKDAPNVSSETRHSQNKSPELQFKALTPAQEYAGEILAYLLQVVLDQDGRLKSKVVLPFHWA